MKIAQFSDAEVREVLQSKDPRKTFLEILLSKVHEKMSESKIMFRGVPRLMAMYYCQKCRCFVSIPETVISRKELKDWKEEKKKKSLKKSV